jgi:hypothetical protein
LIDKETVKEQIQILYDEGILLKRDGSLYISSTFADILGEVMMKTQTSKTGDSALLDIVTTAYRVFHERADEPRNPLNQLPCIMLFELIRQHLSTSEI